MKPKYLTASLQVDDPSLGVLLERAKNGCGETLGQLLEGCRQYLLLVASRQLDPPLRTKLSASDIVQNTFVDAHRDFQKFDGHDEMELLVWLRQILLNNLHDARRQYCYSGKRQLSREISISRQDDSGSPVAALDGSDSQSPSWLAMHREEADVMRRTFDQLSEDHRRVIALRNFELLPFSQIAVRMNRSEAAARKLWARAIQALADRVEGGRHGRSAAE
jgi:RNA polymerase sigma-70 factor (ECF subfamily)